MKDIVTKTDFVSVLTADEFNINMEELENLIPAGGLLFLDGADRQQLARAISIHAAGATFYNTGGTANAILLDNSAAYVLPLAYFNGMVAEFRADTTNTLAVTVNANGIGVAAVTDDSGAPLTGGEIASGKQYRIRYNTTGPRFEIIASSSSALSPVTAGDGIDVSSNVVSVDIPGLTDESTVASNDTVMIWDASAGALREMTVANLTAGSGGGKVLQALQAVKTDQFSHATINTWVAIPGITRTLPSLASAGSKVLVRAVVHAGLGVNNPAAIRLTRNGVVIPGSTGSTATGSRVNAASAAESLGGNHVMVITTEFLDSPSTTAATTYAVEIIHPTGTVRVNRTENDLDSAVTFNCSSVISVQEIGA